ncbi:hypothetical protein CMI44_02535 [Candidatus Pacearchaeota archaeon]|jgi:hypothetical protein|nr:hypothetical protein [Candidatus Pacearchaeota archaeon]|tara:strand:+ start:2402 stop:3061 length:660 start_codon:yes stop_codon:yes gene_type:complete
MLKDKRGQGIPKAVLWIGGILIVGVIIFFIVNSGFFDGISKGIDTTSMKPSETSIAQGDGAGKTVKYFDYIIGGVPNMLISNTSEVSALIIVIALWLLIFITFADILAVFSTFSREVAWVVGFLISVIAANMNFIVTVSVFAVGIFAFLGALSVFVGMFAAFAAFIAVNWGIGRFGPWVIHRRAMQAAATEAIESEAGGRTLRGVLRGLHEAGEGLRGR